MRKRRGGAIHTLALQRFTRRFPRIRWRGSVLRVRGPGRPAPRAGGTGRGGRTPQSEGLVRARGEVWIHTPPPPAKGSLPANYPCAGRRFQRRFEAAEHLVIDGPSVRLLGIAVKDQDPDDRGPQPRLQGSGRACHVPRGRLPAKDRWTRSDPPGRSAWMSHAESPRCRARHRKRWVATVTAASSGAPRLLRWPWRNRNAASDMRNRGRVHWKGDSVSPHPRCRMGTSGTAPDPAESVFKIRFGEPLATPCLPMPSMVTRGVRTGTLSPTRATARDQQIACTDLPSKAQAPVEAATGGEPPSARTFFRADRAVHHRGGIE